VHLALTYSSNRASIDALVAELRASAQPAPGQESPRISIHKVDIGSTTDIERMFVEIESEHKTHVDILISNAGHGKRIVDILYVLPHHQEGGGCSSLHLDKGWKERRR
jgi:3-oxoacyl-[acyl-carrier protein] reductase